MVAVGLLVVIAGACSTKSKVTQSGATTSGGFASSATPVRWQAAGLDPVSAPSAVGGEVFVTAQLPNKGLEGMALDAATGKVLWTHASTVGDRLGGMGLQAPVAVQGRHGLVAVELEATRAQGAAGGASAYVGRDARTGGQLWSYPVAGTLGAYDCGSVACIEVEGDDGSRMVGIDPDTGSTTWTYSGAGQMDVLAESGGDAVLLTLGEPSQTLSVDTSTGDVKWTYDNTKALGNGTTSDGGWEASTGAGNLVETLGSYNGSPSGMFALSLATGKLAWARKGVAPPIELTVDVDATQPTAAERSVDAVPPVVELAKETDTTFDVSGLEGIDPATGRATWTRSLSLHYTKSGARPLGVISDNGKTAWIRDPQTGQLIGTALDTGAAVPATGTAWQVAQPDKPVELSATKQFVGPTQVNLIRLPSLSAAGPRVPPEFLSARTGNTAAWVSADGLLHGAPTN
jgi:hypothetical protein